MLEKEIDEQNGENAKRKEEFLWYLNANIIVTLAIVIWRLSSEYLTICPTSYL